MIRDTPGRASPTDLADDLAVSAAGMTGRLDALEKGGYVQRVPNAGDRRRVDVEATKDGVQVWRRAMALRGTTEEELLGALSERELASFNRLLKKLALHVEAHEDS
jgi:DNA-binding MarR family transcriptional regulator